MRLILPKKTGLTGVVKRNRKENEKYRLVPYHRTREFRRKIAKIYYPIVPKHTHDSRGVFPIFKLCPDFKTPVINQNS